MADTAQNVEESLLACEETPGHVAAVNVRGSGRHVAVGTALVLVAHCSIPSPGVTRDAARLAEMSAPSSWRLICWAPSVTARARTDSVTS